MQTNRPWQCTSRRSRRDVAVSQLAHSPKRRCSCEAWHTATSRTSFWPLFSVSRALRMGGSFSVSNLTVDGVSGMRPGAARWGRVEALEALLTIDDGTCVVARLAKRNNFPGTRHPPDARATRVMSKLTDDLVDFAITDTGSAGVPPEGRDPQGSRANGATSGRREGRTGCPGEGGNAAARGGEKLCISINWLPLARLCTQKVASPAKLTS
jgi:hypothetical protein